jgi:hypothetical protein
VTKKTSHFFFEKKTKSRKFLKKKRKMSFVFDLKSIPKLRQESEQINDGSELDHKKRKRFWEIEDEIVSKMIPIDEEIQHMKSVELIPIWESTPIVIKSNILLQMKDLAGKEVEYGGRLFLTNCDMEQVIGQSRSVDYTTTNSRISYHTHPKITLGDAKPPSPFDIVVLCVMNSFYSKYSHVHLVVTNSLALMNVPSNVIWEFMNILCKNDHV